MDDSQWKISISIELKIGLLMWWEDYTRNIFNVKKWLFFQFDRLIDKNRNIWIDLLLCALKAPNISNRIMVGKWHSFCKWPFYILLSSTHIWWQWINNELLASSMMKVFFPDDLYGRKWHFCCICYTSECAFCV